jgi:hypothetical protein
MNLIKEWKYYAFGKKNVYDPFGIKSEQSFYVVKVIIPSNYEFHLNFPLRSFPVINLKANLRCHLL